jgi:outer membrane autotransporter protein
MKGTALAALLLVAHAVHAQSVSVTDGSISSVTNLNFSTTANFFPGYGFYVTQGSTLVSTGTSVTTTGSSAQGVYVSNGGTVQMSGGSVTTGGAQSVGLYGFSGSAAAGTATISADNVMVQTSGSQAVGVEANNYSNVTLHDGEVNTSGQSAHGLYNIGTSANLSASGTAVFTTGDSSNAAFNQAGGVMTLDNVSLQTSGDNSSGVQIGVQGVVGNGSTQNVTDVSNSTVLTSGTSAYGILASDNATLNAMNVRTYTNGAASPGAAAFFGAQVQYAGGVISTTGNASPAILVAGMPQTSGDPGTTPPSLTVSGLTVNTSGQGSPAVQVASGANVSVSGSALITRGAGSDAVLGWTYDVTTPASATFTNSTLTSAKGNGIHANGGVLDVTLNSSSVNAPAGYLMDADTRASSNLGSVLNVVADASNLTGTSYADSNSTLNATLQNSSVWQLTGDSNLTSLTFDNGTLRYMSAAELNLDAVTLAAGGATVDTHGFDVSLGAPVSGVGALSKVGDGILTLVGANTYSGDTTVAAGTLQAGAAAAFSAASNFTVAGGAVLDLNGFNQTVAGLNNGGTVHFGTAPGTVLTVAGDYAGNGGLLVMNTALGDSSSATDLLHVQGATSGGTNVQVVNAQGLGAQTTGDGIKLVQVDGASNGTFSQTGAIQAGAYQYTLYKGGVDADASSGNWYLRSTLETPVPNESDGQGVADSSARPASAAPLAYRPGVVGYVMALHLNLDEGFSMLGTLHRRVGDVPGAVHAEDANRDGVWGRIDGENQRDSTMDRFSSDSRSFFAQFGKDWTLSTPAQGGSTHAGVTVTLGSASADFSDDARSMAGLANATGSVQTQMQGVGGYWTRYLGDGTYADSVAQITHYRNHYSDAGGNSPVQNGYGFAVSQEFGKPFQVGHLPLAFEPQVQLAYQYLNLGGFEDNVSSVSATTTNALRGRLGFRLFRPDMYTETRTGAATPYFTANLLHDFLPSGQTVVGGTSFNPGYARTWFDVGVGLTAAYGKRGELYASVGYAKNLGGQTTEGVRGNLGYRYSW